MTHKKRNVSVASHLVSIIIPSFKRFDLLQKCLNAIPGAFGDISYEVILVENGSPREEKQAFLSSAVLPPNTKIIELSKGIGFPAACNKGFRASSGALLFFLNNDVILDEGSGEKLVMAMDDPTVGIVGMKLVFPSEQELTEAQLKHSEVQRAPDKIQHVGLFTNIRGQMIHMYLGWSADNPRVNAIRDVYAVSGAALMTRKNLYREVGGFDEIYGMGTYEDCDYSMKVREKGLKIIVEVDATGRHYTGSTAEAYNLAFPLNQNRMIFEQKWYNKLVWTEHGAW